MRAGTIGEIDVRAETCDGRQVIVVVWPVTVIGGMGLVNVLSAGLSCQLETGRIWMRATIQYTDEVDRRIIELIDALIDVRVLHPTMMQLPLALEDEEAIELVEALG